MQQALIVHLALREGEFGSSQEFDTMIALQERLTQAIEAASAGELDGNELGGGAFAIFMYGPDADRLYAVAELLLKATPAAAGGHAVKRYGDVADPNARAVRVTW